jgi:hypothetical protein
MSNITILSLVDRIACFHSLKPFFQNSGKYRFTFTSSTDYCLTEDRNEILIMMRQFIKPDKVDLALMARLRDKYRVIAFFHDDAGGGIPRLEVLPFVDLFYSKALFRDRSLYGKSLYGKELYSNYYHERYGVVDPETRHYATETRPEELAKLRLSWNIGIGDFPRDQTRQRIGVLAGRTVGIRASRLFYRKEPDISKSARKNRGLYPAHCRIGLISRPSISYQRTLVLDAVSGDGAFLTGHVSQRQFNREIGHSRITVSPFGWGELCIRDFEAVLNGSLLLKPDMSHLETWPNIFVPGETYVPFDWDAKDLRQTALSLLDNPAETARIVKNATEAYVDAVGKLTARFDSIMEEICSCTTH